MRKLKHHQQKLLKKVNFYDWKVQADKRETKIIHKYHLQNRDDYHHYNKICGMVTALISKIKLLPPDDQFRVKATEQLLDKLYNMGIINSRQNIQAAQKVSVSAFCRRRLAVLLCILKFAQTMKESVTFIEQGHVRIGTQIVTQPAFLVTKQLQDHVGWVDNSSIKKKILEFNGKFDDYDIMN